MPFFHGSSAERRLVIKDMVCEHITDVHEHAAQIVFPAFIGYDAPEGVDWRVFDEEGISSVDEQGLEMRMLLELVTQRSEHDALPNASPFLQHLGSQSRGKSSGHRKGFVGCWSVDNHDSDVLSGMMVKLFGLIVV